MLDVIEKLLILQERDRRISRLTGELAHIEPERQSLKQKAADTQHRLEHAKTSVREIETARKALELEVQTKKQQIERYANQQLQTRKNEEYRALAHEIDACKAAIFKIEDQEIALMEQAEAAQKDVALSTDKAAKAKSLVEDQIANLNQRETNLKKDLAELQSDRANLAAAVDETARGRYERLFKSKGENVVVGISHGVCGGCHMRLPAQIVVTCQAQQDLVSCTNCGRILYYSAEMDLAVAE